MVDRPSGSGGPDSGSMLADGPLSTPLMKNVPPPAPGPGLWLRKVLYLVDQMGIVSLLTVRTARAFFTRPFEARAIVYQLESVGVKSVGIASVTAVFIGMVMAVQFAISLQKFGAMEYTGRVLGLSFARELAPTLTAVIVGGRVGAGMAAEVGSMAVTEQVDAIRALGAEPVKKLVLPRVAASVIAMPILAMLALVFGFSGGMGVGHRRIGRSQIDSYDFSHVCLNNFLLIYPNFTKNQDSADFFRATFTRDGRSSLPFKVYPLSTSSMMVFSGRSESTTIAASWIIGSNICPVEILTRSNPRFFKTSSN